MDNIGKSLALICIIVIPLLTIPLTYSEPVNSTYYSNSFDSPSAINDGYWSANDTQIQAINGTNVLQINGEAHSTLNTVTTHQTISLYNSMYTTT